MVNSCAVLGCGFSYSRRKIQGKERVSVHAFPKKKEIRDAWVKAIRRENWSPTNASAVCSQHFREEDMDLTGQTRRIREGAVPSLFPWDPSYHLKTITATKHPICQGAGDETLQVSSNSSSSCDERDIENLSPHEEKLTEELKEDNILLPSYPSYHQKMLTSVNVPDHQYARDKTLQVPSDSSSSCDEPDIKYLSPHEGKLTEELKEDNILLPSYPSYHQKMLTSVNVRDHQYASDKTSQVYSNSSSSGCHKPDIADMSPRERKLVEELRKKNLQLIRAKRKIKVLQQKVRRREKKIRMDREVIDELLKTEIINDYNAVLFSHKNDNVCR